MIGLLVAALALRVVLLKMVVGWSDPWSYRFFPTELALFLLGSASWHWLLPLGVACPSGAARCPGRGHGLLLIACMGFGASAWPDWLKGRC